jgi:hypothetical protein
VGAGVAGGLLLATSGCAFHYYNARNGTDHLWGLGQLEMKVTQPNEGVQGVIKGVAAFGLVISVGQDGWRFGLGCDHHCRMVVGTNAVPPLTNGGFLAFRVRDPRTEAQHLWGLGHLKMQAVAPNDGVQAVVKRAWSVGVGFASDGDGGHLVAGWNADRRVIMATNAAVRLDWPNDDIFQVRVGSCFPGTTNSHMTESKSSL